MTPKVSNQQLLKLFNFVSYIHTHIGVPTSSKSMPSTLNFRAKSLIGRILLLLMKLTSLPALMSILKPSSACGMGWCKFQTTPLHGSGLKTLQKYNYFQCTYHLRRRRRDRKNSKTQVFHFCLILVCVSVYLPACVMSKSKQILEV